MTSQLPPTWRRSRSAGGGTAMASASLCTRRAVRSRQSAVRGRAIVSPSLRAAPRGRGCEEPGAYRPRPQLGAARRAGLASRGLRTTRSGARAPGPGPLQTSRRVDPVRTFHPRESDLQRSWHVIDAEGIVLGKLATEIAHLLRGKHKPIWAPNIDAGDHVIVVNASKLDISLRKSEDKLYYRHSGYPGGIKSENLGHLMQRNPERVIRLAVRGMLPKTRLGRAQLKHLKVSAGPTHPHAAQQPQTRTLTPSKKAS